MRTAYAVELRSGRVVELVELTQGEMIQSLRGAGSRTGALGTMEAQTTGLRLSVRKVTDGEASTDLRYDALQGRGWDRVFSSADTMDLIRAFDQIHAAPEGAVDAALAGAAVSDESSVVALPSGRRVTLAILPWSGVQASLGAGDKETAPLAQAAISNLDGIRRSVTAIDGEPVDARAWSATGWIERWPFSVAETSILSAVWTDLHGLGGGEGPTVVARP